MEQEQKMEWLEALKIVISEDLVGAAKQQLKFLAAVDRNRSLYEGPVLQKAIYRYNACWLPLLAKHSESQISEGKLVVPLDCEWIWHCHRLNPIRYKLDCEQFYGEVLDNLNVLSSIHGASEEETEKIWNGLYPDEPYHFDFSAADVSLRSSDSDSFSKYDLFAAVQRQIPFTYQVSRPHMSDEVFLEEAVDRYKGFLHLIKRNWENSVRCFCVPTYDVDLIWHTHQLHPVSYCKDLTRALGKVLEHDDTDSNRTKGQKLDVGFSETTKQWEEKFGTRYWRAGAMYRGSAPSPLTIDPSPCDTFKNKVAAANKCEEKIQLTQKKFVEVLLEIVGIRNLPEGQKGRLLVSFTKSQPDVFFNATRSLTILSQSKDKQVASFQCEPTGVLHFELISHQPSSLGMSKSSKAMGSTAIALQDLFAPGSKLYMEQWFELASSSGLVSSKPVCIRIAISVTIPAMAPFEIHLIRSRPFSVNSCFTLPKKVQQAKTWTYVIDEADDEVISLQMRDIKKAKERGNHEPISSKEVISITKSGKACTLAEFVGYEWSLMDSQWALQPQPKSADGHIFVLKGSKMVKLFPGRKLEYEHKNCGKPRNEQDFITAVEISVENPYGKALALVDLKFGTVKVKEEWFVLPGIAVAFILGDDVKKDKYNGLVFSEEYLKGAEMLTPDIRKSDNVKGGGSGTGCGGGGCGNAVKNGGGCGTGCGSGCCGSAVKEGGGCGTGCGSGGCGSAVKDGGGCGGGCGSAVKDGGGCGGGCGSAVKEGGGCGTGCGSGGCGSAVKDGGGCGGGCGNAVKDGGGCGTGCGSGGCGSAVKDGGSCGTGCGSGGCGNAVKDGGGCGTGCGTGCGGGNAVKDGGGGCNGACGGCGAAAYGSSKSCSDECPKPVPLPGNEAVVS